MTKCINCNKEFDAKRSTAKYCSTKCRKLAFQKKGVSVLIKELEEKSLETLEKEGRWIPNWKRNGYKSQKEVDTMLLGVIDQHPSCKWMFKSYTIWQQK